MVGKVDFQVGCAYSWREYSSRMTRVAVSPWPAVAVAGMARMEETVPSPSAHWISVVGRIPREGLPTAAPVS
jgi:hypothetical protein